jgi:ammonia channel protein AmtB
MIGGICVGFFAKPEVTRYTSFYDEQYCVYYSSMYVGGTQLGKQIIGIMFSIVAWAGIITCIILECIDMTIGLRVTEEQEVTI